MKRDGSATKGAALLAASVVAWCGSDARNATTERASKEILPENGKR
jgi:hypothetical protein